jgi:adenylate cyclase
MTARFPEIRYAVRGLLDQIIGYCAVLRDQPMNGDGHTFVDGVQDIVGIAQSIGSAVEASRPNAKQLENLGRRVAMLSGHISHRSRDLRQFAEEHGHTHVAPDLDRLRAAAESLLPLGRELAVNHEALANEHDMAGADRASQTPPRTGRAPVQSNATLLIVDDNEGNRDLLARRLGRAGYSSILVAEGGRQALELVRQHDCDVILLDVMMPDIDGIGVLREVKQDPRLRDIPVVMVSAVDDVASVATCIELGAEDYLPKPFEQTILEARIRGSLERKRLRDMDKYRAKELEEALSQVEQAREVSERLLRNILPETVAMELQEKNSVDPMYFEDVTIVFTDFVGFTRATEELPAEELVAVLNDYFSGMDRITERYGLEKLKTIGDSYMYAGGLPVRNPAHPVDAVLAAMDIVDFVTGQQASAGGVNWGIRIGVHTGPVIAGVVGVRKFAFDIWGDSVNLASRMESCGVRNRVNLSARTYTRIKDFFRCESRTKVPTKDGYELDMHLVEAVQPKLLAEPGEPPPAFARRYRTYFGRELPAFPRSLAQQPQP